MDEAQVRIAAIAICLLAMLAVVRGVEVRLTLLLAALAIGAAAKKADAVLQTFFDTFSNEKFVLPICSAMGFAYVIRHTGCDAHLVRLLMAPVRRMRGLLVPGVVLVAFTVNIPVISQTSTAVCVGPVAIPLMRAAGFSPLASAATLCLGASVGGELLNPGAPELQTVKTLTHVDAVTLSRTAIPPLLFPYLAAAVLIHWLFTRPTEPIQDTSAVREPINLIKAAVPLVPLAFLFLTGPPFKLFTVPVEALTKDPAKYDARLIGVAMLIGVLAASLASPRKAPQSMKQFFEGAGYGFASVVSLIVTATCFGKAIESAGLAKLLGEHIASNPNLLFPLAAAAPFAFAFISGSGMASTQSLYGFFHEPAELLHVDPTAVGAVVSVGSAAGRTMSPVAAVVLMCAGMTEVKPFAIVRKLAVPLIAGLIATVALRILIPLP